jgi:hypothetical protein
MMRTNVSVRMIGTVALSLTGLLICARVSAQSIPPTMPPPNGNITAPGPQRPAPPQPRKEPPGTRAPQPILPKAGTGTIEGFVYWDANSIAHKPASDCSGLAVTVMMGTSTDGLSTTYTPLATLSNNFKYVGQVKAFLAGGKVSVYDVCTYGYGHVPVGPDLEVNVSVANPLLFSPFVAPQTATLGPIKIINAQCNMLPSLNPSTIADLTAHWGSCQNRAYDVNFLLQPSAHLMSSQTPAHSPGSSGTQPGMLVGGSPQGNARVGCGGERTGARKFGHVVGESSVNPGAGWRNTEPGRQGRTEPSAAATSHSNEECRRAQDA